MKNDGRKIKVKNITILCGKQGISLLLKLQRHTKKTENTEHGMVIAYIK